MTRWTSRKGDGRGVNWLRANAGHEGDDCLPWPYSRDRYGYGMFGNLGRVLKAHRFMCELAHGPAPESPKHHAAHSCGNAGCVNPKHLRWATPKENMADSVRMGAIAVREGESRKKLTEEQVGQILAMRGTAPYSAIGAMFGVKQKQIGKIYRGEQWKRLTSNVGR